jgi:hypothetical protein
MGMETSGPDGPDGVSVARNVRAGWTVRRMASSGYKCL